MVDVHIDTREQKKSYFVSSFIKDGIVPKLVTLDAGDFLVFGKTKDSAILIERKDSSDFLGSLEGKKLKDGSYEKGRIWNQLEKMKASGTKDRRLIIEGDPLKAKAQRYRKKRFSAARIYGAYEGIFKWGVKIVWVPDKYQTSAYIRQLCKRAKGPKKEFALRTSAPKAMTLQAKRLYILQGLPKIGPKASKAILKKYKTLRKFFDNLDKIDQIPGIGSVTKKEIKEIYG